MDPARPSPYPPIRDLAAIGDGRTVALIDRDGTVCWLPMPFLESSTVFASLLDHRRGGRFELRPDAPYALERRYVPDTNVLETTYETSTGVARVTDALTLPIGGGLIPFRELARRVEGRSGSVRFLWSVEPAFRFGAVRPRIGLRSGVPVASTGDHILAIRSWDAGAPVLTDRRVHGAFEVAAGSRASFALTAGHREPVVFPARDHVERRIDATEERWRRWTASLPATGPWHGAVVRSALVLELLRRAQGGSVAAAATTSLPEELGGERNWDYRFAWVRDAAFVMTAMVALGRTSEADAFFWWLMHASHLTRPRIQVLYRMDGGPQAPERTLDLEGYAGSRPVRVGNAAVEQTQLDIYGDLLQTAWTYAEAGRDLDREFGGRLAGIADVVARRWREPDAGIWEIRGPLRQYTQSKMLCWVALDRAVRLAHRGSIPARNAERWRVEARAIRAFVDGRCWSEAKRSYTQAADADDLDASVLLGATFGYDDPAGERFAGTIAALRRELGHGPLLFRYRSDDDLRGTEGAFLCCSFWLAEVLARAGRVDEAAALMDELVVLANDVGLFAEEIDPATSAFLGNFPQALPHLALVSAAVAIGTRETGT